MKEMVQDYLDAFHARDLPRCLAFYDEHSRIDFVSGVYENKPAIEAWHKDRFEVNFRVVRVERIAVQGDKVIVDAAVTSNRLQKCRINSLSGKATLSLRDGKIQEIEFALRLYNPLETWE